MNYESRRTGLQQSLHRLPESARLIFVAIIGSLIGLVVYEFIYWLNPIEPRASSSWLLSFVIGVPRQHALHRWLTFVDESPYWESLKRAYILYTTLALGTTTLNFALVEWFQLHHRLAWLICVTTTGAINLFVLKRFVYFGSHGKSI
jgi:putative flippase GtrA